MRRRFAIGVTILMLCGCAAKPPPLPPAPPPQGPTAAELAFRAAEVECLAQAVYFEARGEDDAGRRAVAAVIMNRVDHPRFPDSVCGVVRQGGETPPCQFSWWCDGKAERISEAGPWEDALRIAAEMYDRRHPDPTGGAMYFHHRGVAPSWKNVFRRTAEIGDHYYYLPVSDDQI